MDLELNIDALTFRRFYAKDITGDLFYGNNSLIINALRFNAMEGSVRALVKIKEEGEKPTLVSFCSEAFYLSPNSGKVSQYSDSESNPLYAIYGDNWLAEVYNLYFQKATEKGLILDKDYKLVYTDSLFIQWRTDREFTIKFMRDMVNKIAKIQDIKPSEVQVDVAIEMHTSFTPNSDFPYVSIPSNEELEQIILDLVESGVKDIHFAELDVKNASSEEEKIITMARLIKKGLSMGVQSVELWNTFFFNNEENVFSYGADGLFNNGPTFDKTSLYYFFLSQLITN